MRRLTCTLVPLAALILAVASRSSTLCAQTSALATPSDSTLDFRLDEYMKRLEALGYNGGLLVLRGGKVVIKKSYGFANRDAGLRADSSTVYNLGSITKQFTAAAILRLEELGKLHTTDSITRWFANVPPDKRGITLHHLLTHSSGLESDFSPTDYEPTTRDEYVRRALVSKLRTPPGAAYFYANAGYSLLAAIVEIATGKDYEVALTELVLRPAGMHETGYKAPGWPEARIAHGYQGGQDWGTIVARIAVPGAPFWELRGNGGLHTTLGDMQRWDAAQESRAVLSDSSRRKYTTPWIAEGPAGLSYYGYGWAIMKSSHGTRLVTHNGGNGVYVAELLRFVDDGVTVFLTSTVADLPASPVVRTLARIAFGEPYELPPRRVSVNTTALNAAAGAYRASDGSHLTLRVVGDRLLADASGQLALSLLVTGDTSSSMRAPGLNTKAATIVAALVRGDVRPLRAALDEAPDSAALAQQELRLMSDRRERLGAFRSFTVLGTVAGGMGPLQTTVRLDFERGTVTNLYAWNRDDRIVDVGARPYQSTELVTMGDTQFAVFNVRSGRVVRLNVDTGAAPPALVVDTQRGPLRLIREN
ncbi:MAG TPA: serine hydrolase domain-containing protein [Gemmatimonadaceae bacterium]|nr:serine hydrolase domain-containing protein [Gemmatimonadaceae bacterium]